MKKRKAKKKKQLDFWHKKDWMDHVKFYVSSYRAQRNVRLLNQHDWDDITQEAIIHIWSKRHKYRRNWPLKPWLKVVALNQVRNQLRNRLNFNEKSKSSKLRWMFRHPQSISTKTVTVDRGIEEVRYEPDIVDARTDGNPSLRREDLGYLSRTLETSLNLLVEEGSPMKVATRLNGGKKPNRGRYEPIYRQRAALKEIYQKALDAKIERMENV